MTQTRTRVEAGTLLSPKKLVMQLVGFAVGLGLLAWIIVNAIKEGQWGRIANADLLLVGALLASTLASTLINGTAFWITIQSVKPLRFRDLQRINVVANMLNYAPIRLGAIGRVLYHMRVDGLSLLQVGAWFSLIGYVLVLGVASCVVATFVRFELDWIWVLLVLGQMILGGLAIRVLAGHPLIVRHGRGLDRMVSDRRSLWGAIVLRLADLGAFAARMAVAAAILEISFSAPQIVLLSVVALAASLIPFGRLGFREFCVAQAAGLLGMMADDVQSRMNQLALVESAGEALVFVPLGLLLLPWFRRKWKQGDWGADENSVR